MAFGVTATGFIKKTYDDIITEKKAQAQTVFGADVDLTETSPLLKYIEATSMEEAQLWDMAESLYYSAFIETATGDSLDKAVKILGVIRKPSSKAEGEVTFTTSFSISGKYAPRKYSIYLRIYCDINNMNTGILNLQHRELNANFMLFTTVLPSLSMFAGVIVMIAGFIINYRKMACYTGLRSREKCITLFNFTVWCWRLHRLSDHWK